MDDVIIIIIADLDYQGIAVNLMKSTLSIVEKWCGEAQLTVNLEKAEAVPFTRKYKTRSVKGLKLFEKEIKISNGVRMWEG